MITDLPEEIIRYLQPYISFKDWRNLLTSLGLYKLKKDTIILDLFCIL